MSVEKMKNGSNGSVEATDNRKNVEQSWMAYIIINYRWVLVCFFLLPASLIYDLYHLARSWIVFHLNSAPKKHDERVRHVQQQVNFYYYFKTIYNYKLIFVFLKVREWNRQGRKTPMCTARPGWQTISFRQAKYKKTMFNVRVNLIDILEIDTNKKVLHT